MKITALIDEFQEIEIDRTQLFQKIKSKTNADALIVVTSGNFTQKGLSASVDKYKKADILKKQGADLVLELPVYCTLTTFDTFAFAAVSMLEKLNCVDELAILCEEADEKLLKDMIQFLFIEPREYQQKIKLCMENGKNFATACAEVTEEFIPGAKAILEKQQNIHAIEYAKAMKRMYSNMKIRFVNMNEFIERQDKIKETSDRYAKGTDVITRFEARLEEQLMQMLALHTEEQNTKYLNEISGGYGPMTKQILKVYNKCNIQNGNLFFEQLANVISNQNYSTEELRRYLLKVLIGVRHVEISICGIYSYALYVRALDNNAEKDIYKRIKEYSWIPVLLESSEAEARKNLKLPQMDDSRRMLLELDWKAQELYGIMSGK
ncbi:MAG: nucleotidyltransferase family protein [Ruminococcus sp.]|uniref:nucleotidyltransferase family protein n=1 Tax=Ruminococcus sp. TaxID=41978 RepID=UPI0039953F66